MANNLQLHSAEKALLDRCQEIGLNESQKKILRDLFGWNNRHGGTPKYHQCIYPQMPLVTEYRYGSQEERQKQDTHAQELCDLLLCLMGDELASAVNQDPVRVLEEILHLPRLSVVWLVAQLRLGDRCPEMKDEIRILCYNAPEKMPNIVVLPTICLLLDRVTKL